MSWLKKLFRHMRRDVKNSAENCRYVCYSGYHNWFYVEDTEGRDVYRICNECGRVEKLFDDIFLVPIFPQKVTREEKEKLMSCIKFVGIKYKLLCNKEER